MSEPAASLTDTRLAALNGPRGWKLAAFGFVFLLLTCAAWHIYSAWNFADAGLTTMPIDFSIFWAASQLALAGTPLEAFDPTRFPEVTGNTEMGWMVWSYPPGFLLLVLWTGALPFVLSWALFGYGGFLAFALALRLYLKSTPTALGVFLLAPAYLSSMLIGQTTMLWLAGFLAAFWAYRQDRRILAGVFIGLLTLKPQLGLLIAVAMFAAREWRVIGATIVTTIVITLGPLALFGFEYLPAMLTMMGEHAQMVRDHIGVLDKIWSVYALLAGLCFTEAVSLSLHWLVAAFAAGIVAWSWARKTPFDLRMALLMTAIPLSTPYLWYYESAILTVAMLFMLRAGSLRLNLAGGLFFLLIWLGAGVMMVAQIGGPTMPFRYVLLPLALIAFALNLRAFLACRNAGTEQSEARAWSL